LLLDLLLRLFRLLLGEVVGCHADQQTGGGQGADGADSGDGGDRQPVAVSISGCVAHDRDPRRCHGKRASLPC
jgi:hypothetical protein